MNRMTTNHTANTASGNATCSTMPITVVPVLSSVLLSCGLADDRLANQKGAKGHGHSMNDQTRDQIAQLR